MPHSSSLWAIRYRRTSIVPSSNGLRISGYRHFAPAVGSVLISSSSGYIGMSYEDALDQAAELEHLYAQTINVGGGQQHSHAQAQHSPMSPTHGLQFSPQEMGQAQAMALAFSGGQVRSRSHTQVVILSNVGPPAFGSDSRTSPAPALIPKTSFRLSVPHTHTISIKAKRIPL